MKRRGRPSNNIGPWLLLLPLSWKVQELLNYLPAIHRYTLHKRSYVPNVEHSTWKPMMFKFGISFAMPTGSCLLVCSCRCQVDENAQHFYIGEEVEMREMSGVSNNTGIQWRMALLLWPVTELNFYCFQKFKTNHPTFWGNWINIKRIGQMDKLFLRRYLFSDGLPEEWKSHSYCRGWRGALLKQSKFVQSPWWAVKHFLIIISWLPCMLTFPPENLILPEHVKSSTGL